MERSVAPYSGYRVGAALLSADGKVYPGCNIENLSLMLSACAEKVALLKAVSEGCGELRAIAVVSSDDRYCFPCGSCRQLLKEFAPGLVVLLSSGNVIKRFAIEEFLPFPFEKEA
jgi:cytidine deaminase